MAQRHGATGLVSAGRFLRAQIHASRQSSPAFALLVDALRYRG
jgi:hypothetical protein